MKNSEKLIDAIKIIFTIFLAALILGMILYFRMDDNAPMNYDDTIPLEDWTVTDPDGNVFSAGSTYRSDGKHRGTYTITTTLPEDIGDGYRLCMVMGGDSAVYIDGKLRKDFVESRDVLFPGGCVKRFYMFTDLGPEDSGAEVTILRYGTTRIGYVYQNTFVASPEALFSYLMGRYGLSFMLEEILLIFSLVIAIISIVMRFLYRRPIEMLYGSMSILVIAGWLITNSYLFPFVYGHYHIDGIVNYLLCLMMPFNLVFYLDGLQRGRYRKIMTGILLTSVASCIIWPLLHFTRILVFPQALLLIDIVLGIQVLIVMGLLIYDAIRGKAKEYGYTAIGFAGFLVCSISEIVILNFLPVVQGDILMLAGLAFLLTLSVVQQIYDLKKQREEGIRAMDLSEAKTRFLASMSHEIRTPINAVLGMNEMILRENKDPVIGEYAQSVRSSGQMLLMLVNDVLDFSKIEAGKMEINEAPYRLSELLRSIVPMLKERADEKELRLKTLILNDVPDGQISDELRLRQILINLINNAIKYTDSGSVTLMIGGEELDSGKYMLRLSVKDTGRGISEEGQAHLFEAFSRADIKKNGNIEGTGLGLTIVKSIVDSLNGEIRVTSKEGEGSEFLVRIPVGIDGTEPLTEDFMEQGAEDAAALKECDYRAPEAKILVVDDNHSNLKLVGLFLKRAGIVPDTCDSGKKAIEKCNHTRYDLILLDHMMPELDGIETIKQIKTNIESRNRDVPVIVLTANAVVGSRQVYLDAGFADYLTKPLDSALLEQTVRKYLPWEKVIPVVPDEEEASESKPVWEGRKNGSSVRPVKEARKNGLDTERTKNRTVSGIKTAVQKEAPKCSLKERLSAIEDLDYEMALHFAGGQEELLSEVVKTVVADSADNIEKMRKALDAGEMNDYGCVTHSIKGQMSTIGLVSFSEWAKKHEYAANDGNLTFLREDSAAFWAKYKEICRRITAAVG